MNMVLGTTKWHKVQTSTDVVPPARCQHSSVSYRHCMYIFAGLGDEQLNDIWQFDLGSFFLSPLSHLLYYLSLPFNFIETQTWSRVYYTADRSIAPDGYIPPRYRHSSVMCNGSMYSFGGMVDNKRSNSLISYSFGLQALASVRIAEAPTNPPAMSQHRCISYQGKLYLFGGDNGLSKSNKLYVFDPCLP